MKKRIKSSEPLCWPQDRGSLSIKQKLRRKPARPHAVRPKLLAAHGVPAARPRKTFTKKMFFPFSYVPGSRTRLISMRVQARVIGTTFWESRRGLKS